MAFYFSNLILQTASYKRNEILYKKDIFKPLGYSNKHLINTPRSLKRFNWEILFLLTITVPIIWYKVYVSFNANYPIEVIIYFLILSIFLTIILLFQLFYSLTLNYHNKYELPLIKYKVDDKKSGEYYIIAKNSDDTYIIQKTEDYYNNNKEFILININDITNFKLQEINR